MTSGSLTTGVLCTVLEAAKMGSASEVEGVAIEGANEVEDEDLCSGRGTHREQ